MDRRVADDFMLSEFACKCGCGLNNIDPAAVYIAQQVRQFFDKRVTVTSGCRCEEHNRNVGGSKRSQHLLSPITGFCHAVDIVVQDIPAHLVQELLDQLGVMGLGYYDDFTHFDTRAIRARWHG